MARERFGGRRMAKKWASMPGIAQPFTASGTTAMTSLQFVDPFTVLRMIGSFMVRPTDNVVALDGATVVIGIAVLSTDAFAANQTPDPGAEPEYPWLYWQESTVHYGTTASPDAALAGAGVIRRNFDIRSMRKVKPRESLAVIGQYVDIVGAPPLTVDWDQTRVLLAVH